MFFQISSLIIANDERQISIDVFLYQENFVASTSVEIVVLFPQKKNKEQVKLLLLQIYFIKLLTLYCEWFIAVVLI